MNNKKNLTLYLMRHGETVWNLSEKIQGHLDSPITENGIKKLKETGKKLENIVFEEVYTSYMERTIKTAEIIVSINKNEKIKGNKIKLKKLHELNEINFGVWQGMTHEEIFKKYPKEGYNYFNNIKKYKASSIGGEDLQEGLERFLKGLKKIIKNNENGNVLVVTHGTVLELFLNYIENKKIDDLDERKLVGNGEYKIFVFEDDNFNER